jgi:hypothetical protein
MFEFLYNSISPTDTSSVSTASSQKSDDEDFFSAVSDIVDEQQQYDSFLIDFAIKNGGLDVVCKSQDADVISHLLFSPPKNGSSMIHTLIMGSVQSGKSRVMFALVLFLTVRHHMNIIVLLRDFTCDVHQFHINLERFLQDAVDALHHTFVDSPYHETRDIFPIVYVGDVKNDIENMNTEKFRDALFDECGSVHLCLSNATQVGRLNTFFDDFQIEKTQMMLFVDEVDELLYSTGENLSPKIMELQSHMSHVFGISATVLDPLHDERFIGSRVFVLPPPHNYKGIDSIIFQTIEKQTDKKNDPEIFRMLDSLRSTTITSNGTSFPLMFLLKNERLIRHQNEMMTKIRSRYQTDYSIIVFNGLSTTVYAPHLPQQKKYVLPTSFRRGRYVGDRTIVFPRADIQDVLQYLKNNGGTRLFPRILIISHNMINRGINIVSRDFEWHLTHMYYRPSSSARMPHLIQSVRLCGRYNDNIPLYLYAEEKVILDIQRGYRLQQELVERVRRKGSDEPETPAVDILRNEAIHPQKLPSCNVFLRKKKHEFVCEQNAEKDKGWSLKEFEKGMCMTKNPIPQSTEKVLMDAKEYYRLTNDKNGMFKKWSDPTNQSAIARFMREGLDPYKQYTKKEIQALCKEFGVQIAHITGIRKKTHTHGQIIHIKQDLYYLYPSLVQSFVQYF